MRVLGIDPSLTSTGIAIITTHNTNTTLHAETYGRAPAKNPTTYQRLTRIQDTALQVETILHAAPTDLVTIEQPAYASRTGQQHDRSGLWWAIVTAAHRHGVPLLEVTPQQVKKYATGRGTAGKDEVLAAVVRRYRDAPVSNNNEADALVLALIGARLLGRPVDAPPQAHLAALKALPTVHLEQAQGTA